MASTDNLVDLHLHILPDVDDGVKSLEASVETVRGLYELGFSELVTTPHRDFQRWRYTEEALQKSFKMFASSGSKTKGRRHRSGSEEGDRSECTPAQNR